MPYADPEMKRAYNIQYYQVNRDKLRAKQGYRRRVKAGYEPLQTALGDCDATYSIAYYLANREAILQECRARAGRRR